MTLLCTFKPLLTHSQPWGQDTVQYKYFNVSTQVVNSVKKIHGRIGESCLPIASPKISLSVNFYFSIDKNNIWIFVRPPRLPLLNEIDYFLYALFFMQMLEPILAVRFHNAHGESFSCNIIFWECNKN